MSEQSFLATLHPFMAGSMHSMVEPSDVVTHARWPTTQVRKIHVIRIGGAGMSAVARLAREAGIEVTGSESQDGQFLAPLAALGARTTIGFSERNLEDDTDAVVVSTAVRADNPEVQRARARGIPVLHRASALAGMLASTRMIAVAGTHGKTTTTAMAALALRAAGEDPAWAVGAAVEQLGANAGFGAGTLSVVEADESDGSFVAFAPHAIVLTNFEADHLDFHGSVDNLAAVISAFIARLRENPGAALIACADDDGSRECAERAREAGIPTVLYGRSAGADWRIIEDLSDSHGARVQVQGPGGELRDLRLRVPGIHNALNALGAYIAGLHVGGNEAKLREGLASFEGAQRRFQTAGVIRDVRVIDDYAHHPREIEATITAARQQADGATVIAVFQPHLFSRTKAFTEEFAHALSMADSVILTPIYPAREDFDPSISSEDIAALIPKGDDDIAVVSEQDLPGTVARMAGARALVLMMGAGTIVELSPHVLDELRGHLA